MRQIIYLDTISGETLYKTIHHNRTTYSLDNECNCIHKHDGPAVIYNADTNRDPVYAYDGTTITKTKHSALVNKLQSNSNTGPVQGLVEF
jgi:hypothetical protein